MVHCWPWVCWVALRRGCLSSVPVFSPGGSCFGHYRAAAVRTQMLQIAATLERARDPDPECMTLLQNLLANDTGNSPLYNRHIPAPDLETTLRRIRAGLETQPADPGSI